MQNIIEIKFGTAAEILAEPHAENTAYVFVDENNHHYYCRYQNQDNIQYEFLHNLLPNHGFNSGEEHLKSASINALKLVLAEKKKEFTLSEELEERIEYTPISSIEFLFFDEIDNKTYFFDEIENKTNINRTWRRPGVLYVHVDRKDEKTETAKHVMCSFVDPNDSTEVGYSNAYINCLIPESTNYEQDLMAAVNELLAKSQPTKQKNFSSQHILSKPRLTGDNEAKRNVQIKIDILERWLEGIHKAFVKPLTADLLEIFELDKKDLESGECLVHMHKTCIYTIRNQNDNQVELLFLDDCQHDPQLLTAKNLRHHVLEGGSHSDEDIKNVVIYLRDNSRGAVLSNAPKNHLLRAAIVVNRDKQQTAWNNYDAFNNMATWLPEKFGEVRNMLSPQISNQTNTQETQPPVPASNESDMQDTQRPILANSGPDTQDTQPNNQATYHLYEKRKLACEKYHKHLISYRIKDKLTQKKITIVESALNILAPAGNENKIADQDTNGWEAFNNIFADQANKKTLTTRRDWAVISFLKAIGCALTFGLAYSSLFCPVKGEQFINDVTLKNSLAP
ncbi:MAG: hypothetical protein Q8R83_00130 [Legionellaceae bacterium]|nr:hypothetical protein [Legionellaceae bacterium]